MSKQNSKINEQSVLDVSQVFIKIFKDLLRHKILFIEFLPISFIVAAVYALSLPNTYSCSVRLSPEISSVKKSGGLIGLASNLGIELGIGATTEALYPSLYPILMQSVDFRTSLFLIKVKRESDGKIFTYFDYLKNEQKIPWWSGLLDNVTNVFSNSKGEKKETKEVNPFRLTAPQSMVASIIRNNVQCEIDRKTSVITITVTDQDPVIAATIADSVKSRLQKFITDYRINKARIDLNYNKKQFAIAKERYDSACINYANFSDSNQDAFLQSTLSKKTELENEMNLRFKIYQEIATQLQRSEMKVQLETPAFTSLQNATVPLLKSGPPRAMFCIIFVFIVSLLISLWIMYKEQDFKIIYELL